MLRFYNLCIGSNVLFLTRLEGGEWFVCIGVQVLIINIVLLLIYPIDRREPSIHLRTALAVGLSV